MSPLHAINAQPMLWAIFMLTGIICAMIRDMLRLILGAFQTSETVPHIISHNQTNCILSSPPDDFCIKSGHTQNIPAHFVTFCSFSAKLHPHIKNCSDLIAGLTSGILSALMAAAVCFIAANGHVRPYMAIAMAAGAALYHATVGRLMRCFVQYFLRIFRKSYNCIASCAPVRKIFR